MSSLTHLRPPERIRVKIIESPTPESIERAKAQQETDRAEGIARLLAHFNGIERLDLEPEATRQHFAKWGWIAVRGSELSSGQFRTVGLALHAAAQAGCDLEAHKEHYQPADLLATDERSQYERKHWYDIATRIVKTYHNIVGGETLEQASSLYGSRLRLVKEQEAANGDPRRI